MSRKQPWTPVKKLPSTRCGCRVKNPGDAGFVSELLIIFLPPEWFLRHKEVKARSFCGSCPSPALKGMSSADIFGFPREFPGFSVVPVISGVMQIGGILLEHFT